MFALVFIMASEPDFVPLYLPPTKIVQRPRARDFKQPDADPIDRRLDVSAFALGAGVSGGLSAGPGIGGHVGYRLIRQFGVFAETTLAGLWGKSSSAFWFSLPLGAFFQENGIGPGALKVSAALTIDFIDASAVAPGLSKRDRYWTFGATGGLGYVFPLGYGRLTVDVRYRLLAYSLANVKTIGHGAIVMIGYAFHFL